MQLWLLTTVVIMKHCCHSGLLHVGDIVKEVNGQEVTDPNQLTNMLKKVNGTVTFKVLPCTDEQVGQQQVGMLHATASFTLLLLFSYLVSKYVKLLH